MIEIVNTYKRYNFIIILNYDSRYNYSRYNYQIVISKF